ncbi:hypothetical protein Sjap_016957 [Stephania japonica]|uniref:Uncharacterized protein n=1 Tax=Stephania japonica TaxID=461633 RepID=A0AAP0I596_9MAGN
MAFPMRKTKRGLKATTQTPRKKSLEILIAKGIRVENQETMTRATHTSTNLTILTKLYFKFVQAFSAFTTQNESILQHFTNK